MRCVDEERKVVFWFHFQGEGKVEEEEPLGPMKVLSVPTPRTKPPRYRTETKVEERAGRWLADIKRTSNNATERERGSGEQKGGESLEVLVLYNNSDVHNNSDIDVHIVSDDVHSVIESVEEGRGTTEERGKGQEMVLWRFGGCSLELEDRLLLKVLSLSTFLGRVKEVSFFFIILKGSEGLSDDDDDEDDDEEDEDEEEDETGTVSEMKGGEGGGEEGEEGERSASALELMSSTSIPPSSPSIAISRDGSEEDEDEDDDEDEEGSDDGVGGDP